MKTLHTIYTSFAKRTAIILTLLLTLGATSAWGADETLTITYDSFKSHSTSYQDQQWSAESSDGTSISGSATVCFTNNYDYIQLKNGHPAFRNTTALPGALKSITLTRQATGSNRQITMYVSTSLITKDNYTSATSLGDKQVTTSGVTWTLTSNQQAAGYKYFYFHGSGSVCYLDNVVVTYAASCTNSVAVSAGSKTNVNSISFNSSSIATCSLNAADRQVTVTVTPNTGYEMTSSARLTFTKTSGTATATYVSGPTASGSSYQFVYQFNQNDNGKGAFSASCTAKTSTISFNQNGGEGGTASVTATYGQNMPTPITLPTRYGHTFGGYYDGAGGTGTQYYKPDGTSARTWNKTSSSATLHAQWTEKELTNYRTSCTTETIVTLDPNGGTISNTDGWTDNRNGTYSKIHEGTEIALPTATQTNYIFGGWYNGETKYESIPSDLDESITLTAKWLEKQDAGIYWDSESVTVTIDADGNTLPVFNNPNEIDGIEFSSSNPSVVAVDANGVITLGSTGTTATVTITATFDGNETYAAKTVTCSITVHPSNCRWVEVTDNTTLEDGDEVVITMTVTNGKTYTLYNTSDTKNAPSVHEVNNISGTYITSVDDGVKWVVNKDADDLTFKSYSSNDYLYCINQNGDGVRVGNTSSSKIFIIDNESGYLKHKETSRYLGVYKYQDWRCYANKDNFAGQTLKFYKKTCLPANKFWIDYELANVTCITAPPHSQIAKSETLALNFEAATGYALPDNVTVTGATPSWNKATGTLTISNPTANVTITIEALKLHTITWMVGSNSVLTEEVANTTGVTKTPTNTPANNAIGDCADTFMGWTETLLGSAEGQSAPADLCTAAQMKSKHTSVTGDKTFYAVFATAKTDEGEDDVTTTFDFTSGYENGTAIGTKTQDGVTITFGKGDNNSNKPTYYDSGNAVRVYAKNTITVACTGLTKITFTFGSDDGSNTITANPASFSTPTWTGSANSVKFTIGGSSGNRRIQKVAVTYTATTSITTYSNYVTNCCNTPAPTNGAYTSVSGTEIKLTWEDAANTNRYHITGGNLSAEGVYEKTNKYYNIIGLTECEEYTFYVSAYPEDGCESEAIAITAQPFSGAKTVTFNYNGNGQANTTSSTSCGNTSITLPTPVWTGYRFMGWFNAANGGTKIGEAGVSYTPTDDITLHAHWEKEYTVTYDLQGGTASPVCSGDKYIAGEIVIICTNTPVKSGYRFTGWTYAPDVTITDGQFTMPESNVTITAEFVARAVTNIEVATNTHRVLMQGSTFIGEQIRVTYDNGETELLEWSNSKLTFAGHNTNELGVQIVTVTYIGEGTAHTQYNIEVIDGLGITFWDGDYTETIKYEPGDLVDVDNRIGQNICPGWEFTGWSETKVANESDEYVPVHNFNATDAKVLYAVYVKIRKNSSGDDEYESEDMINDLKEGARYVLAYYVNNNNVSYGYTALTPTSTGTYYLAGTHSNNSGFSCSETKNANNSYIYHSTAVIQENAHWQLIADGIGYWQLLNLSDKTYLDLSGHANNYAKVSNAPNGKIVIENAYDWVGDNNSQLYVKHSTATSDIRLSWDRSNSRFNQWDTNNGYILFLTKDEEFTSTPPCSPLSATFHGNGGIVTDGVNSGDDLTITEPTRDAGITTPTASFADCNGKSWTFVGWAREEIDVTRVPVLTTDLLHDGGGNKHYDIEEDDEEFWAVYTNQGNPETKYGTITFTKENFPNTYDNISKSCTIVENGDSYNFYYTNVAKPSGNSIQIQEGEGYLTNTTSLGKINSISFTNFIYGNINCLKVSLGTSADALTTVLTTEELQVVDGVYTYYPKANYSFFKIESIEDAGAVGIETISIDFGKGTQIWATTPDCSIIRILTDEEVYVTATKDRGIMSTAPLTIKTQQLDANADVVITSTSSDVYFSATRDANFAKAAANQPKTSLTLNADADGNLQQEIYVHYKPSAEGNGTPASVVVSANLATPNPSVTDDQTIYVRNLPAKFVIATKVGATWYALPANMSNATNPEGVLIEVDETTMTATAPNTASYTLFPVKTTNGEYDRYATNTTHYEGNAYGDRVRFAAVNNNNGLWANNNENGNTIRNYAAISSVSDGGTTSNTNPSYEWKITTTVVDGNWQYTLQTDQDKNQQYLRYWVGATGAPKWGTYASGNEQLYFLPVTETKPFDYKVVEWYPTKMLIQTDATIANPTAEIGDAPINNVTCTNKGSKLYEIAGLPLESNPTKVLTIKFSDGGNNYTNATAIPVIISQSATTVSSAPFTTLTKDVYNYSDLIVRDGATLTINGTKQTPDKFVNVTIYPTAKIVVPENKQLSVYSLTFFGGIDDIYDGEKYTTNKYGVPQLSLKGTLGKTVTTMDYIMRVNLDQMYQVGVPYDVNLGEITYWDGSAIKLGEELYVSAYDGQARANLDMSNTWRWEVNFAEKVLKAGVGYTISAEPQVENDDYSILRMPMKSNISSGDTEASKQVPVIAYANQHSVQIADNHKGWNYLSNPYMTAISGGEADSELVLGYLKETGTGPWAWVNDEIRYVTIPHDDGEDYSQKKFSEAVLKPFKSFFVQIATDGELSFALTSRQNAPARYMEVQTEQEVEFEILLSNDKQSDNTGLLIAEQYSPAYEINADLEKMIGSMSVYTIYGGYNLAYNAISPINASEWIPMGYIAPAAGEYTFRLDDIDKIVEQVEHVYLIDYDANNIVDLMDDEYEFTTDKEQNNNRFAINIVLIQDKDNTTTGMDIINGNVAAPIKFIYHDKMYIQSGGVIYDGTGKQVTNINK